MVLLLLYLMMLVGAFCFPESKKLAFLLFSLFCFLFAFGRYQGDYQTYLLIYSGFNSGLYIREFEPLFSLTFWIAAKIGLSFVAYRLVMGLFICISMYRIIARHTSCVALASAVYGLFPFFMYTTVLRSGVACIFVLLAIEQLIKECPDKKRFVLLVLIATLFHYSSILFLLLVLFDDNIRETSFILVFIVGLALAFIINYTSIPYKIVSLFTSRQKTLQWFSKSDASANFNGILGIAIILVSMYALSKYNLMVSSCFSLERTGETSGAAQIVLGNESSPCLEPDRLVIISYKLSLMMFLYFPLMVLASPFTRLPFMVYVLVIISTVNMGRDAQLRENSELRPGVVSFSWIVLVAVTLVWKIYFDLPYLKEGSSFFWEYLDVSFI